VGMSGRERKGAEWKEVERDGEGAEKVGVQWEWEEGVEGVGVGKKGDSVEGKCREWRRMSEEGMGEVVARTKGALDRYGDRDMAQC
jgi:hypothetical protein